MTQFEIMWREKFGPIPPLGYRLRDSLEGRWTRFHALPKSKRYADNDKDRSIILSRANALACELFKNQESFWLAASRADESLKYKSFNTDPYTIQSRDLPKTFSWSDPAEAPEDRIIWSTHSRLCNWSSTAFDDIFSKIANEEDYGVIFAASDMSSILAPYDGGFDIIVSEPERADKLREKYPSWLPEREDGL